MGAGDVVRRLAAAALLWAAAASQAAELEARSSDGRWILRADNAARELVAVDAASGAIAKRIPIANRRGASSRVARLIDAPPRKSFIALLADIPEAWELPYDPNAEPVFEGLVHDYRMGEGIAARGPLPVRRIELDVPLTDVLFSPRFDVFVAAAGAQLHVVNLNVRRRIETIESGGAPSPAQGATWHDGGTLFLIPDADAARLIVVDARTWTLRAAIELPAPARAVRAGRDAIEVTTDAGALRLSASVLRRD